MRALRKCILLALVAAMVAPAGATGIPFRQAWNGPVYMHMHDYAQGTVYAYDNDPQSPTFGQPLLWGGGVGNFYTPYTPSQLFPLPGNAMNPGEAGWAVFQIDQIFKGALIGPNTINIVDPLNPLFEAGDQGLELVGTLFGRVDLLVTFSPNTIPGQAPKMEFEFHGDRITLFTQSAGTFDEGAAGSSGRLPDGMGGYLDKYVSVGYDAAGNPIAGSELVLTGHGDVGYYGSLAAAEGRAAFTPAGVSGSGDSDEYFSFDGGTQLALYDLDGFIPNKLVGGPWPNADLRVHTTNSPITPSGVFDWLVQSSDPVTSFVIPEPMTMLAVFGGVAGLAGYIRKRR